MIIVKYNKGHRLVYSYKILSLIIGWFWSGSGSRISPTNSTPKGWPRSPWSHTGYIGQFLSKYLIIKSF